MKKLCYLFSFLSLSISSYAQVNLDSLLRIWQDSSQVDTVRLDAILHLCFDYAAVNPDSTIVLGSEMLDFAKAKRSKIWQIQAEFPFVFSWMVQGKYQEASEAAMRALKLSEEIGFAFGECMAYMILGECSYFQGKYPVAVHYSKQALIIADELLVKLSNGEFIRGKPEWGDFSLATAGILGTLGLTYNKMGADVKSIESYERALIFYEAKSLKDEIARILNNIAIIYKNNRNVDMALSYYEESTKIAEEIDSKYVIVANLTNTGNIYKDRGDYKRALENINQAIKINAEEGELYPSGYLKIEIGAVYMEMKDYANANEYFDQATENLESTGAKGELITIMSYKCRMFVEQDHFKQAISLGEKGLKMAEEVEMIVLQRDFSYNLYEACKALQQSNNALGYHERLIILEDSLGMGEIGKTLQKMEFSKQILADSLVQEEEKLQVAMAHQSEVNQKDKTRNVLLGSGFLVLLMAGGLWNRLNFTRKSKATLQVEKDRSENLLLNILPAEVAEELKVNGAALAKDFDLVSIIFTDFKGFTETSAKLTASELVSELNYCFKGFDLIMEKYNIEKIKTIGDAYMAAGGLLGKRDGAIRTVRAALEMQEFISKRKAAQAALGLISFEMRAGIHTGPVVAGIVGVKKFQYDIWGDTVKTASRMESNGEVGQVNISEDTYAHIKEDPTFSFEKREKIEVQGKVEMDMYFVS